MTGSASQTYERSAQPASVPDTRSRDALIGLLSQSLAMWRVNGTVNAANTDRLVVALDDRNISIARAPAVLPFRWLVTAETRTRGAASVAGVLRIVREAAGVATPASRLRIAPLALHPPE